MEIDIFSIAAYFVDGHIRYAHIHMYDSACKERVVAYIIRGPDERQFLIPKLVAENVDACMHATCATHLYKEPVRAKNPEMKT